MPIIPNLLSLFSTVNPATRFVNALIYAVVAGFVLYALFQDSLYCRSIGDLNYVNQYTKPFNDISSVLSELQSFCSQSACTASWIKLRSKRRGNGS